MCVPASRTVDFQSALAIGARRPCATREHMLHNTNWLVMANQLAGQEKQVKPERLDEAMKRTRGYWYDDGLADIAVGVVFLLIGLLNYAQTSCHRASPGAASPRSACPVSSSAAFSSLEARPHGERAHHLPAHRLRPVPAASPRRSGRPSRSSARSSPSRSSCSSAPRSPSIETTQLATRALIPALQGVFIGAMMFYIGYWAVLPATTRSARCRSLSAPPSRSAASRTKSLATPSTSPRPARCSSPRAS